MPLRFEFGDEPEASLAFAYSPLLEAVLSLHVLTVPKHHALQHQWVRAMRTLPPALPTANMASETTTAARNRCTATASRRRPAAVN